MTNCKFRNVLKRELQQTNDNMKELCIKQNKNKEPTRYGTLSAAGTFLQIFMICLQRLAQSVMR